MHSQKNRSCLILGHSIDAITSAVVLASLGNQVQMVSKVDKLNDTLMKYEFEHHVLALWQLYLQKGLIVNSSFVDFDNVLNDVSDNVEAVWFFSDDWFNPLKNEKIDSLEETFIHVVNTSQNQKTAYILSGKNQIGYFDEMSAKIHRPWVYYVPFVFLQDGQAYSSMLNPKLWLLGEKTKDSWQRLAIMQPFMHQSKQSYVADIATIEFSRGSIMGMLATRVSYMNELSRLADAKEVDITTVSHIMGLDERIGASYLKAGWGFGGRTLPTEVDMLANSFVQSNTDIKLIKAVSNINDDQKELIFRKFWKYFDGLIEQKTVMVWGASYKAGSGRTQNSAIHPLLSLLWSYDIKTLVCADKASGELLALYPEQPKLELINNPYDKLEKAQAIFVLNWDYEQPPQVERVNEVAVPVFDTQNVFTANQLGQLTSDYIGIGRKS